MQRATIRIAPNRRSGGERVFTDDEGRLWSAALEQRDALDGALVFRCISDGRQSVRALFVDPHGSLSGRDAVDDAVAALHMRFPGFVFTAIAAPQSLEGAGRLAWGHGPAGAEPQLTGLDVALIDGGRIAALYTFLDLPA